MSLIFLDTETTDLEQKRLVQLAYKQRGSDDVYDSLFKPPVPISAGASATSHITNEDVADCPVFAESEDAGILGEILTNHVLVAHNAKFDVEVLQNEGVTTNWYICTQKIAQSLLDDPEIEKFSLQYLRYYLGLYKLEDQKAVAHDAYGDIIVLENLFNYLFNIIKDSTGQEDKEVIASMINTSVNPLLLKRITYGKHNGKTYEQVAREDASYLTWIRDKKEGASEDELFTVKYHIGKIYNAFNG